MTTNIDMKNAVAQALSNPMAIQRRVLELQEASTNGEIRIVDPSNPVVLVLEAAVAAASANHDVAVSLNRRQYASSSQTMEDLYYHMADADYINRFAKPATAPISFLLRYSEVINSAIPLNDGSGVAMLTFPRNTVVSVAGHDFCFQYPVDIRVLPHGGVTVTYDTTVPSPLSTVTSNMVDYGIMYIGDEKGLRITVPLQQLSLNSNIAQVTRSTGFTKYYNFDDNFYYCRAFIKDSTGWREIRTTHQDQVYDPLNATIVLKVLNKQLGVTIPQIYLNNGKIVDNVRVDIYTTRGPVSLNLASYTPEAYTANFKDLDNNDKKRYSAPLNTFGGLTIYCDKAITGGDSGMSFSQLRKQVMSASQTASNMIITQNQVSNSLESMGYSIVTNVDNITDRQFLATRALPPPLSGNTVTGPGCTIQTFRSTLTKLATLPTVNDHNHRLTILPTTVYKSVNGVLEIVSDAYIRQLKDSTSYPADGVANIVNASGYLYTPFYYVLDLNTNYFNARAYRLDSPKILSKYFVQDNPSLGIQVASINYGISMASDNSGYVLYVEMVTSDVWSALGVSKCHAQLSFSPAGSTLRTVVTGALISPIDPSTDLPVDGRWVYSFSLATEFDVDNNDNLILSGSSEPVGLISDFDIVYIVQDYLPPDSVLSDIDSIIDPTALSGYTSTSVYRGVSQERVNIHFGDALTHLWNRVRSVADSMVYQTYTSNIPAVYGSTVLKRDVNGALELVYNQSTGTVTTTVLHNVGDPVLDVNGAPVFKHRIGDTVLDGTGKPIPVTGVRGMVREVDLLLLDGRYNFATDESTIKDIGDSIDTLTNWITSDIELLAGRLINRSDLYFYPKTTVGKSIVIVSNTGYATVSADQYLSVTYHVSKSVFNNPELKSAISDTTVKVISRVLQQSKVAVSDITAALKESIGNDVFSVDIHGFMENNYTVITLTDQSMQPCIGKRLVARSNLTLQVQDAVNVVFVDHGNV